MTTPKVRSTVQLRNWLEHVTTDPLNLPPVLRKLGYALERSSDPMVQRCAPVLERAARECEARLWDDPAL